jgi:hypothetical protein
MKGKIIPIREVTEKVLRCLYIMSIFGGKIEVSNLKTWYLNDMSNE